MTKLRFATFTVFVFAAMSMLFACGTSETPATPTAVAKVTAVIDATSDVDVTAITVYKPPT